MKYSHYLVMSGCVMLLGIAGCAMSDGPQPGAAQIGTAEMSRLQEQLQQTRQENADLQASLSQLKSREGTFQQAKLAGGEAELPPNASPGECYARVFVPPESRSTTEQVLTREASEKVEVIPARYNLAEEKVLVKEASERVEVIPAKYGFVEEKVLVKDASERLVTEPAVYDTISEKILVRAAYTTWKKGRGPIEKIDQATGEIMCLVTTPAEYKTVTKRILKKPEATRKVAIPAEYRTVKKRVVVEPAKTRTVAIPAEYSTLRVNKLVQPAQERRIAVPAEYNVVTKQEKISDGRMEWRPILCETNATRGVVSDIQKSLTRLGYNPGRVDGVIGQQTMAAVKAFQRDKGLVRGQLTMETIKALKVNLSQ